MEFDFDNYLPTPLALTPVFQLEDCLAHPKVVRGLAHAVANPERNSQMVIRLREWAFCIYADKPKTPWVYKHADSRVYAHDSAQVPSGLREIGARLCALIASYEAPGHRFENCFPAVI